MEGSQQRQHGCSDRSQIPRRACGGLAPDRSEADSRSSQQILSLPIARSVQNGPRLHLNLMADDGHAHIRRAGLYSVGSRVLLRWCAWILSTLITPALAQNPPKYSADVPAWITTPDKVETRIGTLRFHNGAPDEETVSWSRPARFSRGVDAFLTGIPATSVRAACNGPEKTGIKANEAFGITENLMDARSLFLTPNTTTVYVFTCLDLANGPMVLQVPTGVLGPVDDAYFRWVTDIGVTGPDAGKGGQYLSCRLVILAIFQRKAISW